MGSHFFRGTYCSLNDIVCIRVPQHLRKYDRLHHFVDEGALDFV